MLTPEEMREPPATCQPTFCLYPSLEGPLALLGHVEPLLSPGTPTLSTRCREACQMPTEKKEAWEAEGT
jgi:hypothetical protein